MSALGGLEKLNFDERECITRHWTAVLVRYLQRLGHFQIVRRATLAEEDEGKDWLVLYPGDQQPVWIQFKLRIPKFDNKRIDCPVVLWQPLYGIGVEGTCRGRDYRGLVNKATNYYYVAYFGKGDLVGGIYRIPCNKLRQIVTATSEAWRNCELVPFSQYPEGWLTKEHVEALTDANARLFYDAQTGAEIWFKRNKGQAPKVNFYLPGNHGEPLPGLPLVPSQDALSLRDLFLRLTKQSH